MDTGIIISANIYVKGAKWWKSINGYYIVNNDNDLPWKNICANKPKTEKQTFA